MNYHEGALKIVVDQLLATDPRAGAVLGEYLARMMSGGFSQAFVDMVFQKDRGNPDLYDAYVFGQVFTRLCIRELAILILPVPSGPLADRETAGNNAILRGLAAPFVARFHGGRTKDDDGSLRWDVPTRFNLEPIDPNDLDGQYEEITLRPGSVPLEVGTTKASRTLLHLTERGGIARWPYDSAWVTVLVDLTRMNVKR